VTKSRRRAGSGKRSGSGSGQSSRRAGGRQPNAPIDGPEDTAARAQPRALTDVFIDDPITGTTAEIRRVQPFEARKEYICPGCNQEIRRGAGHLVVVPLSASDLRRHWHAPCLQRARQHGHR